MEFKITKYSPKNKEELPPINRPTRSATGQIIKNHIESKQPIEIINKIDPLVLAAQYEREINRLKMNHNQMLEELHKELEVLRSKNRDLLDELIIMNGGNYCCKHLENLRHEILKSNASDNQKQISDILCNAKNYQISMDTNNYKNYNHKNELPELIAVGNNFISKDDNENKSNLLLQDQLNKCNKLIDVLQKENIEQNNELNSLNALLSNGLKISGVGLNSGLIRKNMKTSKKMISSLSHSAISYFDIINSESRTRTKQ
ncbi:uncharacterized protein LOC112692827 isoform X2 [Sipha flava]|uniref:Uncharacterized protein LOC112692827 isoform X2 n=1 Tax=Sipha flava TaxID=143950 RepID=A0A8B8GLX7_9HEMI|nr:uncharacterized protein LOC112692827 isoform X2 [Sipha flava]